MQSFASLSLVLLTSLAQFAYSHESGWQVASSQADGSGGECTIFTYKSTGSWIWSPSPSVFSWLDAHPNTTSRRDISPVSSQTAWNRLSSTTYTTLTSLLPTPDTVSKWGDWSGTPPSSTSESSPTKSPSSSRQSLSSSSKFWSKSSKSTTTTSTSPTTTTTPTYTKTTTTIH